MHKIRLWVSGAIGVVLFVLILQNMATVETHLLFWSVSMPRALLLAITAVGGYLVGVLSAVKRH